MTLIIGMHLGPYVLLGADTRVTYYPNDVRMFRDDAIKIRRTSMGLVAGAGLVDLLDPVKDRLNAESVRVIDRIVEIVQEQVTEVKRQPWAGQPRVSDAIERTGWMCTFIGTDSSTDPPTHPLRLGVVRTQGNLIQSVPVNDVYLLVPTDTTPDQWKTWYRFAKDNLRPLPEKPELDDLASSVGYHAAIAQELMKMVASLNDGVAERLQLGVHVVPFLTGITGIITPENDITLEWYEGNNRMPPVQTENS